ncbi:hypothetical protein CJ030_MR7G017820 [Morella rubra]|uniref:Uncharacterized protein n=1 Tax=Morella rubra TaxID=262757 RepID=A0A6A1V0T5_9ROSI|nr:hypothetical protein CJ030_MR7G017820 [Morella rubra]
MGMQNMSWGCQGTKGMPWGQACHGGCQGHWAPRLSHRVVKATRHQGHAIGGVKARHGASSPGTKAMPWGCQGRPWGCQGHPVGTKAMPWGVSTRVTKACRGGVSRHAMGCQGHPMHQGNAMGVVEGSLTSVCKGSLTSVSKKWSFLAR